MEHLTIFLFRVIEIENKQEFFSIQLKKLLHKIHEMEKLEQMKEIFEIINKESENQKKVAKKEKKSLINIEH